MLQLSFECDAISVSFQFTFNLQGIIHTHVKKAVVEIKTKTAEVMHDELFTGFRSHLQLPS